MTKLSFTNSQAFVTKFMTSTYAAFLSTGINERMHIAPYLIFQISLLKALFTVLSSGCNTLVSLSGIIASIVYIYLHSAYMESKRYECMELTVRMTRVRKNAPLHFQKNSFSHSNIMLSHIHPFSLARMTTSFGKLPFSIIFLSKMTISFSFCPFSAQPNMHIDKVCSFPVVVIDIVFSPVLLTVLFGGQSKERGTYSMFMI